ncbi:MAG: response regulator [Spirochaetales bacterium]|nr:response regulator [Spirochaetales bacterium]
MKDRYKLVLVEDEAPIRRNLVTKIENCNLPFEISGVFKNGKQALEWIESNRTDLIITDIKMPIMDGLELAENVYNKFPQIFIAIISGYSNFEYAREAIKYRVSDYLTKPVDIDELRELLVEIEIRLDKKNPDYNIAAEKILMERNSTGFVDSVCCYIKNHYKENITVQAIAEEFSCNHEYLSKVFKKNKGITLQHYIIDLRISEAKKIIRTYDNLDIQSVGDIVGYSDQYYFSRIFKKYTTMSPLQYKKLYKRGFDETP